jgi:hypothetical protein
MASVDFKQVERFAALFPAGECPKFPQSIADLPENMTARERIKQSMPDLWQQLHGGAENQLPADVLLRMHRNELGMGDVSALRAVGMEAAALTVEARAKEEAIAQMEARMIANIEAQAQANEQARAANEMARMESAAIASVQLARQNRGF